MANLNPSITDEKLLLLKGTREKLATLDITPGAIYFTTDYPGIYVDFAAEGGQAAKRVRMGDVTIVDTLSELKDLAESAITAGQKLGKETLYYAKDKNVLCIYDEDEKKFVWINDISELQSKLATLTQTVDAEQTKLSNLITNDIGSRASGNEATSGKTIFKAIEDEYARATQAEGNLQGEINALKGTGSGSIGSLQKEIDDLEKAHNDYETATNSTLAAMQGTNWSNMATKPTLVSNASAISGHETRIDTIEQRLGNITDDDYKNVIEDIEVSISGNSADVTITNKVAQITLPKNLAAYDGNDTITNINTNIGKIKNGGAASGKTWTEAMNLYDHESKLTDHETRLGTAEGKLNGIEAGAEVNKINDITVEFNADKTATTASVNVDEQSREATITLPTNLSVYDGGGVITGITTTITNDVKGTDWGKDNNNKPSLMSNKAAIDTINQKLSGIQAGAQVNKVESITVSAGTLATGTKTQTTNTKDIALTIPGALGHLTDGNRVDAAETEIGGIKTAIGSKTANHVATKDKTIYAAIEAEYTRATGAEQAILNEINNKLAIADAMTFKGAISLDDDHKPILPTSGVLGGDTYVLSVDDINAGVHGYHAGDMFIAGRDQEATETSYPSTIIPAASATGSDDGWYHVKTGYDGIHESKLSVIADKDNGATKTGNKIALTSHIGTQLGSVEFTTASTNLAISKTAGQDGQISLNLMWATF